MVGYWQMHAGKMCEPLEWQLEAEVLFIMVVSDGCSVKKGPSDRTQFSLWKAPCWESQIASTLTHESYLIGASLVGARIVYCFPIWNRSSFHLLAEEQCPFCCWLLVSISRRDCTTPLQQRPLSSLLCYINLRSRHECVPTDVCEEILADK